MGPQVLQPWPLHSPQPRKWSSPNKRVLSSKRVQSRCGLGFEVCLKAGTCQVCLSLWREDGAREETLGQVFGWSFLKRSACKFKWCAMTSIGYFWNRNWNQHLWAAWEICPPQLRRQRCDKNPPWWPLGVWSFWYLPYPPFLALSRVEVTRQTPSVSIECLPASRGLVLHNWQRCDFRMAAYGVISCVQSTRAASTEGLWLTLQVPIRLAQAQASEFTLWYPLIIYIFEWIIWYRHFHHLTSSHISSMEGFGLTW